MEKYLDKKPQTSLSKSDVAAYVHDMKELEIKHYTLKKFHEQLLKGGPLTADMIVQTVLNQLDGSNNSSPSQIYETKLKSAAVGYERAKQSLNTAKQSLDTALQNRKTKFNQVIEKPTKIRKPPKTGDWAVPFFFLHLFSFGVIVIVLSYILTGTPMSEDLPNNVLSMTYLSAFFGSILMEIVNYKIAKKHYTEYLKKQQEYDQYINQCTNQENNIKYCQNQYELAQKDLSEAKKAYEEAYNKQESAKARTKKLNQIAEFIAPKIAAMEQKKDRLYSLNIIPPDYRTLDCIIELDQMYRNDLVDTMREAIKFYEERVFRGELIRGVDKIYNMLGQLNATMSNIENVLYSIQNEVSRMNDNLEKIVSSNKQIAAENKKFQDDMIAESRAARYATEALRDTTDRCEWYMNRQYWNH